MTPAPSHVRRAVAVLLAIGAITHLVRLSSPREVVFDEAIMGPYVRGYCCTGERVFDLHPPHAKLLIAASARLGGYDGAFTFEKIGTPYGDTPIFWLRLVPALAGTLIPALFLLLLLEWRASFPIAALGGLMLALDNALILESRIIVWDGVLVAATLAALVWFFAAERRGGGWRLIVAGALAGLAAGTKFTGLGALAIMGVCLATGLGIERRGLSVRARHALILGASAFAIYAAGWVAHWALLSQPGPADAFFTTTGRMVEDIVANHRAMMRENVSLAATHPDASAPWTWPWMKVAPYFWQGADASIYLVGNPVVWWGAALVFFSLCIRLGILWPLGLRPAPPANPAPRLWVPLVAYGITFLPLLPVSRVLFLYHYLTPLVFSVAFVLLWLDRAGWARPGGLRDQRPSYLVVAALTVAGFLAVSPLTYGVSVGGYDEWLAEIVRSWR